MGRGYMGAHKMKNEDKTKGQLEKELNKLCRRISELKAGEIKHAQTQASLRESERMLSTLIRNLPGMAYRCLNDENWTMEFISEGFFTTQDTMAYSSKKPFDFNAGGKGADLLRINRPYSL